MRAENYYEKPDYDGLPERLGQLSTVLEAQIARPPGDDLRVAAFAEAVVDVLNDPKALAFKSSIAQGLFHYGGEGDPDKRTDESIMERLPYMPNLLLRTLQKKALSPDWKESPQNPRFPHDFLDKDVWRKLIDWTDSDGDRWLDFSYDLRFRDVASNVPQRYASFIMAVSMWRQLHQDRFQEPPRGIDFGCSQKLGFTKLTLGTTKSPFHPIEIVYQSSDGLRLDETATDYFNDLLVSDFKLGESVAVDKVPPFDSGVLEWVKACSRRPSEFLDRSVDAEYDSLYWHVRSDEVPFCEWDITEEPDPNKFEFQEKDFDVGFTSYVLYEIAQKDQASTMDRIMRYASQLMISQEPRVVDQHGAYQIVKDLYGQKYNFVTSIADMLQPNPELTPYIIWEGGRCRRAQITEAGKLMLRELEVQVK